jgi:hypothetical protein
MDKEDARKQTLGELHARRKQVIRLYKRGHKVMQIVELTRAVLADGSNGDRPL